MPPYEIIELDPGVDPIYEVAEEPEVYADVPAPTVGDSLCFFSNSELERMLI